jgi:hypothetical protein
MKRLPGWRSRMQAMIAEVRRRDFAWDDFDCGPAWAGRHVDHMLGTSIAARYAGRYRDARGAARLVAAEGHRDLAELVSSHLPEWLDEAGRPAPSRARVGDLAAMAGEGPLGWSLGIVLGARILVLGASGVMSVDLLAAARAWKVGDA